MLNFRSSPISQLPGRSIIRLATVFIVLLWLAGCVHPAGSNCLEQRAAFDIGSSTLKMKVARINICSDTLQEVVLSRQIKVPFAENVSNQQLSAAITRQGIEQLQLLKKEADRAGAQKWAGVATAVFRQTRNSEQFVSELKRTTGISIRVISQDEEAILGYRAAGALQTAEPAVVWDIGGNSMQLITRDRSDHYLIYRGETASISFKNRILEKLLHQNPTRKVSPNPIGRHNLQAALELAGQAAGDVPPAIQKALGQKDVKVIGIGGVHNRSVRKHTGQMDRYTRRDLTEALHTRLEWDDARIGGTYADTDITNLILVLGYMTKLGIDTVYLQDVNLTDGVLIDPSFWQ